MLNEMALPQQWNMKKMVCHHLNKNATKTNQQIKESLSDPGIKPGTPGTRLRFFLSMVPRQLSVSIVIKLWICVSAIHRNINKHSRICGYYWFLACRSRQASIVLERYFRFEVSLLSFYACERDGPIWVSGGSDIIT